MEENTMKHKSLLSQIVPLTLVVVIMAACGTSQPTATAVPPTAAATALSAEIASLNPSARDYVSMAYDEESERVILFGGLTSASFIFNGETWAYDPSANTWTQMEPPSGPTARGAADMAYDAESDRVILVGGATDVISNQPVISDETWAYDYNTNTWTEMAKGPAKHNGDRLAYDTESDRVILFGGYDMSGFFYDTTWAYDFNSDTWTDMKPSTSPPGRNYHAMAYDAESDRVIIWGGDDMGGDSSAWAYDYNNNTWQKMASWGPYSRSYISMVYDVKADRTILYGNITHGDLATWVYDYNTNTWTKMEPATNPGVVSRHAMAYSTAADRVILFGGEAASGLLLGQTWSYDLNANSWTDVTPHP
jgi:N-acetylneuraminic acid mutarotase